MVTLEEVMEEAQAIIALAERDDKLLAYLIGDFYERIAEEKIANLRVLHNA